MFNQITQDLRMKELFKAECTYQYDGTWTKGKEYSVYKVDIAVQTESSTDGYGSTSVRSDVSHYFLVLNDKREFVTMNCCNFKFTSKLEQALK